MVVLHLISSEGYYGAESMVVALAGALSRFGCRCALGVFRDSRCGHVEVADHAQRQGLAAEIVPCNGRWDWRAVGQIRRLLEDYAADVLHTHGYKADIYGYGASWLRRTALVATCHNWPDRRPIMRAYAVLDRLVLRRFDRVAAASESVAEILRHTGMPDAAAVSNGVEFARFRRATPTLRGETPARFDRLVGFVGRLVPEKGGALLIGAAQKVLAVRPRTGFVFVGEGPCGAEWRALADQFGICGSVFFAGVRDDMPGVYASFDIVVLPSLVEATPMCLLEALAAARPVIATRVGSVPAVVIHGVTGLLLEPGDIDGLAAAVLRLLADPDLARRMAEQGSARVAQYFSAEAMAAAYIDLYEQALARRRHRDQWQLSQL